MPKYDFVTYLARVRRRKKIHPSERWGQAYNNQLFEDNVQLWYIINDNHKFDTFYRDELIPDFLRFVGSNWELTERRT